MPPRNLWEYVSPIFRVASILFPTPLPKTLAVPESIDWLRRYDYKTNQWEFSLDQLFEEFQGKQNYDVLDTSK